MLLLLLLSLAAVGLVLPPKMMREAVRPWVMERITLLAQGSIDRINDNIEENIASEDQKILVPATTHDAASDPRREVSVRVIIERLWEINSTKHRFSADVLFEASWVADESVDEWAKLLGKPDGWSETLDEGAAIAEVARCAQEALQKRALDVWNPELFFGNLVEVEGEAMRSVHHGELYEKWYRVKPHGNKLRIRERARVVGGFSELFELQNFPADRQCLTLVVRSKKPPHLIHLALPSNGSFGINSDTFVHAGSWDLSEWLRIWETRSLPHETLNVPPPTYPQLHVRMRVVRKFGHFLADILAPQGLLTIMATSSLLVPRSSLGERLAITLTMTLASIAFKSQVTLSIPPVSYNTFSDIYIDFSFIVLFLLLVADLAFVFLPDSSGRHPMINRVHQEWAVQNESNFPELDSILFGCFLTFTLLANLLFVFRLWLLHEANHQWLHDTTLTVGHRYLRTTGAAPEENASARISWQPSRWFVRRSTAEGDVEGDGSTRRVTPLDLRETVTETAPPTGITRRISSSEAAELNVRR